MKTRLNRMCAFKFIAAAIAISIGSTAAAAETSSKAEENNSLDAKMALTARFVTLPDAPAFTARGEGKLAYTIKGDAATIKGESIPKMTFESGGPIADFSKLTVIAEGIPGTTSTIGWSGFPKVTIKPLDLRFRAYEADADEITSSTTPLLDVVISDISLSTERIVVEGVESQGYIDVENLEAQVVGKVALPNDDLPQYKEWLAGEPAILELLVKMKNFFAK